MATGPVVGELGRVVEHLLQLLPARRGEHTHARHPGEHREVVDAVMAGPVGTRDPGPVEAEDHRQPVQRDVVHHLVPRPVEERRVERDHRPQAAHRHPGGARDGVLLGDADVEEAIGEAGLERQQAGRSRHRRGDRDQPGVRLGLLDDRLGERLRVSRRHRLRWSGHRVEHGSVVEVLLVVVLGRRVAATLLGEHVDDDRPLGGQLHRVVQGVLELGDVVPVDRPDVAHAERLEERRRLEDLAHRRLDRLDRLLGGASPRPGRHGGSPPAAAGAARTSG